MSNDKEIMRNYVTGADHLQYSWLADGMVQLDATHSNLKQYVMELRLDLHTPIREVKRKLYTHNGTSIAHMELHLRDAGRTIAIMTDDERPLGYYGARNGMEVHVVDTDPHSLSRNGGLDDVSQIEKFRMSDEAYDARPNTLRAFKKKKQAEDPNFRLLPEAAARAAARAASLTPEAYMDDACVSGLTVGSRVEVSPGARRGTLMWLGSGIPSLAPGYWVGVRLDEPLGRGDGSRGGVTYFSCPDKYGAFVRPNFVVAGDFPPEDDIDSPAAEETDAHTHPQGGVDGSVPCCGSGGVATAELGENCAGPRGNAGTSVGTTTKVFAASTARRVRRVGMDSDDDDDEL